MILWIIIGFLFFLGGLCLVFAIILGMNRSTGEWSEGSGSEDDEYVDQEDVPEDDINKFHQALDDSPSSMLGLLSGCRYKFGPHGLRRFVDSYVTFSLNPVRNRVLEAFSALYVSPNPDEELLKNVLKDVNKLEIAAGSGAATADLLGAIIRHSPAQMNLLKLLRELFLKTNIRVTKLRDKLKALKTEKVLSKSNEIEAEMSLLQTEILALMEELSETLPHKQVKEKKKRLRAFTKSADAVQNWINTSSTLKNPMLRNSPEIALTIKLIIKIWYRVNEFIENSGGKARTIELGSHHEAGAVPYEGKSIRSRGPIVFLWGLVVIFIGVAVVIWILKKVERFDVDKALTNVVQVETPQGEGAGFIIDHADLIVTNYHVVVPFEDVSVQVKLKRASEMILRTFKARVIGYDEPHDIAILDISEPYSLAEFPAGFSMCREDCYRINQTVHVLGNPVGLKDVCTSGKIIKVQGELALLDVMIGPGSSGGPVCDESGLVIGITTGYVQHEESGFDFGIAIPPGKAWELIDRIPLDVIE